MRNAYALLGISFIIVFGGAYILFHQQAEAPSPENFQNGEGINEEIMFTLTSPAFEHNGFIPSKYTCDGENANPPLYFSNTPDGTKSFVLVMDDPDIPQEIKDARGIEKFDHWAIYNIDGDLTEGELIPEHYYEEESGHESVGSEGLNGRGAAAYTGPCPPTEYEPTEHRYIFRLYALSGTLNFIKEPTLDEIEEAAKGMTIEKAELIGRYSRVAE